jgi:hypothetical protein
MFRWKQIVRPLVDELLVFCPHDVRGFFDQLHVAPDAEAVVFGLGPVDDVEEGIAHVARTVRKGG